MPRGEAAAPPAAAEGPRQGLGRGGSAQGRGVHDTGRARLPGVVSTADEFGGRRVAARGAGAPGGGGGGGGAAVAPRVRGRAPRAETRRTASGQGRTRGAQRKTQRDEEVRSVLKYSMETVP